MGKSLFIAEKPSVAKEFAKILKVNAPTRDGYIENDQYVITWCVGHLVNMSYPEKYDENLRRWSISTLPFLPLEYKYEVISSVEKQFEIVKGLLCREDVEKIYVCTDSGREGEYIYRLVDQMAEVGEKDKRRVWIDSQTEEEILRGIREAKPLEEYNSLADSAYLRAKEDYLIGINFSRLLTLLYGRAVSIVGKEEKVVIAIGRVMTCVLGMVVDREREIRNFVKTNFYKLNSEFNIGEENCVGEWRAAEGTAYFNSPLLYNDTGFKKKKDAEKLAEELRKNTEGEIVELKKKQQKENAPLLFNLAELQNECSKRFKISPDETLSVVQTLYEKKLVTYPRTDARVLSTAIAKEIAKNVNGLANRCADDVVKVAAGNVIGRKYSLNLLKSKYVDDSKITDHYAIIPTGQGFENYSGLKELEKAIYQMIGIRFLAVFYPPAVFNRVSMTVKVGEELFFANTKTCKEIGYLEIMKANKENGEAKETLGNLKKGQLLKLEKIEVKEGETTPPSRYTTGTMILAMENAGKLIEDEELRAQIKGAGIGTSATRAEIIKKLQKNAYILCNSKTQVITPSVKGELIYEVVKDSMPDMLNPELTASWEKGLTMVANQEIGAEVFMEKLENYIKRKVHNAVERKPYINPPRMFKDVKVE
ncbi:MAG: DNA topoisomerase III [Clostridia bacterium]|nr:DNA topoisomerase III [Clostridia bacterium]